MAVPDDTLLDKTKRRLANNPIVVGLVILGLASVPVTAWLQVYTTARQQPVSAVPAAPAAVDPAVGPPASTPLRSEPAAAPHDPAATRARPQEDATVKAPYDAADPALRPAPEPPDTFAIPDGQPRDRTIQPAYPPR